MSIGLKKYNTLYHGTSYNRAKSIQENGFEIGPSKYDRWLGPKGIYFVSNRPLIALRFAEIVASEEDSNPVIFSVNFRAFDDESVLDLTSDTGMNSLYEGYTRLERVFKKTKHSQIPRTPDCYFKDLDSKLSSLDEVAKEILDLNISSEKSFNWDSAALRLVAMEDNCRVIIAAIQEGTSFNLSFYGKNYRHRISRNYKGLCFRDHIEICIVDKFLVSCEDLNQINFEDVKQHFSSSFVTAVLDYRTPDASQ